MLETNLTDTEQVYDHYFKPDKHGKRRERQLGISRVIAYLLSQGYREGKPTGYCGEGLGRKEYAYVNETSFYPPGRLYLHDIAFTIDSPSGGHLAMCWLKVHVVPLGGRPYMQLFKAVASAVEATDIPSDHCYVQLVLNRQPKELRVDYMFPTAHKLVSATLKNGGPPIMILSEDSLPEIGGRILHGPLFD